MSDTNYSTIKSDPKPTHHPEPSQLPAPAQLPAPIGADGEADPLLTHAWREHMIGNFKNNQKMFQGTLRAFRTPYWMTIIMYGTLFLIGICAFVAAIYFAVLGQGDEGPGISMALLFGGLSVASFLAFFIRQPLQALEDNLKFSAWMGGIYNTYWTQLMYAQNPDTVQGDIRQAAEDFNLQMERLIRMHTELRQDRPGKEITEVPRIGQPLDE